MSDRETLTFFVDVDDTFVRSFGTKRIPIDRTIRHLKSLSEHGAELYCWSSGGAEYARQSAAEFGIEDIFVAFLPKPHVMIDDVNVNDWKYLLQVHPNLCGSKQLADYVAEIASIRHPDSNSGGQEPG